MGIRNLKFKPFFLIYLFVCIYFGWYNTIFFYIVTVVLHEYAHFFVAKLLGYDMGTIVFNFYGAGVNSKNNFTSKHDIIISLAGPLMNLLMIILIVFFWWVIPSSYIFTYDFYLSNLVVMIFNILPIYPLDGGRVLFAILAKKKNIDKIKKINKLICILSGAFFILAFFVFMVYKKINYTFLFIGMFLLFNSLIVDNEKYRIAVGVFDKKYNKPLEVKVFKIKKMSYVDMVKLLSPHYYSVFEYFDGVKWARISEDDLLNIK